MKALLTIIALSLPLHAHDSPSHTIEHLTEHISQNPTASLYAKRAAEHRQLGNHKAALADFQKAQNLEPNNPTHLINQATLPNTPPTAQLHYINQSLKLTKSSSQKALVLKIRAATYLALNQLSLAQSDITQALKLNNSPPADWFFTQSQINLAQNNLQKRATDLEAATKRNPSAALHIAWLESLIDANQAQKALPLINQELNDSRLKSSWLIRRARAYKSLGKYPEAKTDLTESIKLLNARINPNSPNPILTESKTQAQTLLNSLTQKNSGAPKRKPRHKNLIRIRSHDPYALGTAYHGT